MFRIFLNINFISYSFRSILANQNGIRYSDSTSYFKKYSSSKCKQTVCLHTDLTSTLRNNCTVFLFFATYFIFCSVFQKHCAAVFMCIINVIILFLRKKTKQRSLRPRLHDTGRVWKRNEILTFRGCAHTMPVWKNVKP
jgi:hypothetical protein